MTNPYHNDIFTNATGNPHSETANRCCHAAWAAGARAVIARLSEMLDDSQGRNTYTMLLDVERELDAAEKGPGANT